MPCARRCWTIRWFDAWGHLVEAHVRPTLEVILTESPAHLRKEIDKESGLAIIRI